MAVLYISEYGRIRDGNPVVIPMGQTPELAVQNVAIGAGSVQSAAFQNGTRIVRLHTDAVCAFKFGPNPTAVATANRMAAGQTEYFSITPGDKVAVITAT